MAGMLFELFIFLTLIGVGFLLAAVASRRVWPALLSCVFFVLTGATLLSEGLQSDTGATWDAATGVLSFTSEALTANSSIAVAMLGNVFFYGGFLVAVASIVYLYKGHVAEGRGGI